MTARALQARVGHGTTRCYDDRMKRTTVSLPDDLGSELEREAHRRRTSQSEVVREALRDQFGMNEQRRHVGFAAIGASGDGSIASRDEEVLAEIFEKRMARKLGESRDR